MGAEEGRDTGSEPVSTKKLVNAKEAASVGKRGIEVGSELEDGSLGVRDLGDRTNSDKERHLILEVGRVFGKTREHLGCALGVSDVGDLLTASLRLDHVNDSWEVILSHFIPAEIPELLPVDKWIKLGMIPTVWISA